ncbi:MAG: C69 family dipeptidase [bacterium]
MNSKFLLYLLLFIIGIFRINLEACTNLIVTKGASTDGSVMITYSADSYHMYGELYHLRAAVYSKGAMLEIYEWDTGKYLGKIPQAEVTYNVIGNINEYQVAIGETTFGGREELVNPDGMLDYGSLMYIALQRAKTACEAIKIISDLTTEYGYCSSGESFSIADANEAWIFELVGKGKGNKGILWVAQRIPDGYVSGHANQSRITTFPLNDKDNCLYSPDVISFARENGYFSGEDKDFSFSDAYCPLDFGAIRFCDGRVWSMFRRINKDMGKYIGYIRGETLERMPLFIKPDNKISVHDAMMLMRDHFEGTEFDMTKGIAAGPYNSPYRCSPLTWRADEKEYFNERPISTYQTGFSFVTQSRSHLPREIGGVIWFGVDDTYMTVYSPMYCSIKEVPYNYKVGLASLHHFNWDSVFWLFNFVSTYVYPRYSLVIGDIQLVQNELEGQYLTNQQSIENTAITLFKNSKEEAIDFLTNYSVGCGKNTYDTWKKMSEELMWRYNDGVVKNKDGELNRVGYPEEFRKLMAEKDGAGLLMKQINNPKENEIQYKRQVKLADECVSKKEYDNSKKYYNEALKLKPEESYPKSQIEKIDKVLKSISEIHDAEFSIK